MVAIPHKFFYICLIVRGCRFCVYICFPFRYCEVVCRGPPDRRCSGLLMQAAVVVLIFLEAMLAGVLDS